MFAKDKISIIVPAYNVEDYFERSVDSILSQTYKNIEVILVDDGSPDTSGEMGDRYAFYNENVLIVHKINEGLSEARNDGVDISTGYNIAFVDSDDYILPKMYEKMFQCKSSTKSDIVVCQWQWQDKNGIWTVNHKELDKTINGEKSGLEFEKLTLRGGYYECLSCVAWNKLYPRKIFQRLKFWGRKTEDVRFNDQVAATGVTYFVMDDAFYIYCESLTSITRGQKFSEQDFVFLELLIKRIELFKNDMEIVMHAKNLYCSLFVEDVIVAQENKVRTPEQFLTKYREFCKDIIKSCGTKKRLHLMAFYYFPNFISWIYVIKKKWTKN